MWEWTWGMGFANGNGTEETGLWKRERKSESGNGNEDRVVTMGMEKMNFATLQKHYKFKMYAFSRVGKNITHHAPTIHFRIK